jgi:hypothetical protein
MSRMPTILKLTAGFGLLIAGCVVAVPGVPGPGIVLALSGLVLLSEHFAWARRALVWTKQQAARVKRSVHRHQSTSKVGEPRASTGWTGNEAAYEQRGRRDYSNDS